MASPLDIFGKLVMRYLRDESFNYFEKLTLNHWKDESSKTLQKKLELFTKEEIEILRLCVRNSVDTGIHSFLFNLYEECERGNLDLKVKGESIHKLSDGFHGELFSEEGWINRFSKFEKTI